MLEFVLRAGNARKRIGTLLLTAIPHLRPSRYAVVRSSLWRYYMTKIPRMVTSHEMGPGDMQDPPVRSVMLLHLISAVGGGAVAVGIGYVFRRCLNKPTVA